MRNTLNISGEEGADCELWFEGDVHLYVIVTVSSDSIVQGEVVPGFSGCSIFSIYHGICEPCLFGINVKHEY